MQGFQLTLFTIENRRHHGKQLSHWLLQVLEGPAYPRRHAHGGGRGHRP
ncbi:hypothetical protein ACU4HD_39390 [Cupriavidus basilensis]